MNATGHPVLGFDPAPGVGARVTEVATNLGRIATETAGLPKEIPVRPSTPGALADNPAKAIQNAAQYSHVNSVNMLNKLPKVNIDPFSAGGIAAGAAAQTGIKVATREGAEYGMNKLTSN